MGRQTTLNKEAWLCVVGRVKKTEKMAVSHDLKGHSCDKNSRCWGNGYWILGQHYLIPELKLFVCACPTLYPKLWELQKSCCLFSSLLDSLWGDESSLKSAIHTRLVVPSDSTTEKRQHLAEPRAMVRTTAATLISGHEDLEIHRNFKEGILKVFGN